VAVDLLAQRPRGAGADRARARADRRELRPRSQADPLGLALVTGAALALVWGLVRGNPAGWGSVEVLAALVVGGLLAVAFVVWELRARGPMLPMRLFRSRRFSAANAAMFFHWASALGALYFMAQFLQNGLGYGPLDAGLRLMPWGAVTVIVPQVAGRLIARLGERPFITIGMALNAVALATIALLADATAIAAVLPPTTLLITASMVGLVKYACQVECLMPMLASTPSASSVARHHEQVGLAPRHLEVVVPDAVDRPPVLEVLGDALNEAHEGEQAEHVERGQRNERGDREQVERRPRRAFTDGLRSRPVSVKCSVVRTVSNCWGSGSAAIGGT
jgi:hypothetical protein